MIRSEFWSKTWIIGCFIAGMIFLTCSLLKSTTLADSEPTPTPSETPVIVVFEVQATPTPIPMTPPPSVTIIIATPTPTIELPAYDYPAEDRRCLSRGMWSVCPANPTRETKIAFAELVQNRVDDDSGDFEDTIRWVLLQGNEFMDYNPDAYLSKENNMLADYAMRTWIYARVTGDRSLRLVSQDGLYCDFYGANGYDYIRVYNRDGAVVYDSGLET